MGFQVSPGVTTREIDLTTVIPAVSSTEGAIAGVFRWGPVEERVLIDSETNLVNRFGRPTNLNPETFFSASNFLAYGNKLYVSRGADSATHSAMAFDGSAPTVGDGDVKNFDAFATATFPANVYFVARHLGDMGNSLKVSTCDSATSYASTVNFVKSNLTAGTDMVFVPGSKTATLTLTSATSSSDVDAAKTLISTEIAEGDFFDAGGQMMKVDTIASWSATTGSNPWTATLVITFKDSYNGVANLSLTTIDRKWEFFKTVNRAPGTSDYFVTRNLTASDEIHVVVTDEDGIFTGTPGTILEVFEALSRATDAKSEAGANNYYKDVINNGSSYLWAASDIASGYTDVSANIVSISTFVPNTFSLSLGADGADEGTVALSAVVSAWDMFREAADVDISFVIAGKARGNVIANYVTANIAMTRKDCIVFISPSYSDVVGVSAGAALGNVIAFRNSLSANSSYAIMDSGYKYQYDKYSDVFRYVPLNGDIAGIHVRSDNEKDPWWSAAGFNRGQVKNSVKLAYNPRKADRDQLYQADVNPVVTMPGQGTILFGDKTLIGTSSAFSRINVRRLFIVLEKAIAKAANSLLFEFNDEFTRASFVSMVSPFLRNVQGRRGIIDFAVVADTTNNTPDVIDRNEFVGSIAIKPNHSINFITLNFIATRTNVTFSEVIGAA